LATDEHGGTRREWDADLQDDRILQDRLIPENLVIL